MSLSNKTRAFFFFKKVTLWKLSGDTELYTTMAVHTVCQNCSPFVLRSGKINPVDSVLRMFPLTSIMFFFGFMKSSLGHSSSGSSSSVGLRGVKKTVCLSPLLGLAPATSRHLRIEVQSKEHPL